MEEGSLLLKEGAPAVVGVMPRLFLPSLLLQVSLLMLVVVAGAAAGVLTVASITAVADYLSVAGAPPVAGFPSVAGVPAVAGFSTVARVPAVPGTSSVAGFPSVAGVPISIKLFALAYKKIYFGACSARARQNFRIKTST